MRDIKKEYKNLTNYSKFYNFLKITRLIKLVAVDTKNFSKIDLMLKRLAFIQDKFYSWISSYKIENNRPAHPKILENF